MAKSTTTDKKIIAKEQPVDKSEFAFGKENFILFIIAFGITLIGYALMAGGKAENPSVFNEEIFSFRRITLAPVVVIIGYIVGVYAILKKAD
jgi:hypothetical protein